MVYSKWRFILSLALCFVLVFSVLLVLRLPRLGKRELVCVLFVRLYVLRVLVCVSFLLLLVSGIGRDFYLWFILSGDLY